LIRSLRARASARSSARSPCFGAVAARTRGVRSRSRSFAAALRRQPERSKRIAPSCCGEPITNSSPPPPRRSACSSVRISSAARRPTSSGGEQSRPHSRDLHLAQHADERQLDIRQQPVEIAARSVGALQVGQRSHRKRVAGAARRQRYGHVLAELRERIARRAGSSR